MEQASDLAALPEGTVTIVFTDVEDSTPLAARIGDEEFRSLMRAVEAVTRDHATRNRGREVKGTGDGQMLAFTSARRAVECAIDIQRELARRPAGAPRVRIGIHAGEVIHESRDLFGTAVNVASRIGNIAPPAEILISEAVRLLLGPANGLTLEDAGSHALKGLDETFRLFRVEWADEGGTVLAPAEQTPFVGRSAERARLVALLDSATRGSGGVALVGGEPGVGKSRLVAELCGEARRRRFLVLRGNCYETEAPEPYLPWAEILEEACRVVPLADLRQSLAEDAPEVAKLAPFLRRVFADMPEPAPVASGQERRVLHLAIRDSVARAAQAQPLLLVLEDVHWADDASLDLLQLHAQLAAAARLVIVFTYRDVELDVSRPLARFLEGLHRSGLGARFSLKRLDRAQVGEVLRARANATPPEQLVDLIFSETEGNPFFVEEVFRYLQESGRLFDPAHGWKSNVVLSDTDVPESVRLVIGRRLERISPTCQRMLTVASVAGLRFPTAVLAEASDIAGDALLDALDEGVRAGLIQDAPRGRESVYAFSHEIVRQTVLRTLSLPRRQQVHLRVGHTLERVYAARSDEHAAEIANHLLQAGAAGDQATLFRYLRAAGDAAAAASAWHESARFFSEALAVASPTSGGDAELLLSLGRSQRLAGLMSQAGATLTAAYRSALEADLPELMAEAVIELGADVPPAELALVIEMMESAIARNLDGDPHVLALLYTRRAKDWLGFTPESEAAASEARALAERYGFEDVKAELWDRETHRLLQAGHFDEMRLSAREGLAAFERIGDAEGASHAMVEEKFTYLCPGELDEALARASLARQRAERSNVGPFVILGLWGEAAVHLARADLAAATACAAAMPDGSQALLAKATIALTSGEASVALEYSNGKALLDDDGGGHWRRMAEALRAAALFDMGEESAARSLLSGGWGSATILASASFYDMNGLSMLGGRAGLVLEPDDQQATLDQLERYPSARLSMIGQSLDLVRGSLALALGRIQEAKAHYQRGYDWAVRERCPLMAESCMRGLAEVTNAEANGA